MACGRLVPDGVGRERRRDDRHHRPARRCRYRCLARRAARLLPRGAPAGHAADPQVTETIKHTNRPCFVLGGCIPLRRGASSPAPRGSSPAAMPARPATPWPPVRRSNHRIHAGRHVPADHRQRPGGRLARAQATGRPAVTEFGSQPGDRVRVDTVSGVADIVLTSPAEGRVTRGSARLPGTAGIWIAESINLVSCPHACSERPAGAGRADA
jgi:hypothetical protein